MTTSISESTVRVQGTVYGVALYAGAVVPGMAATPAAPVLFIKPTNTWLASGGTVHLPADLGAIEANAALALVIGRDACRISAADALSYIAGATLAIDLSEPNTNFLRINVQAKCHDGFLPIGPRIVSVADTASLTALQIELTVDGAAAGHVAMPFLAQIAGVIEHITEFITLRAGDALLIARMPQPAAVKPGQHIAAISPQIGRLECTLAVEEGAA